MADENLHIHKSKKIHDFYVFLLFLPSIVFVVILVLYLSTIQKNKAARTSVSDTKTVQVNENIFTNTVILKDKQIHVALANDNLKRAKGLSILQSLPEDYGMLFVFPPNSRPHFWMKNMVFPIDIIWIDDGKVVQIDENAMPPEPDSQESDLKIFTPTNEVDYVLEVNAGFSQLHDIKIGDDITIF